MNWSKHSLNTDGSGYWSNKATSVELIDVKVPYINDEKDFGELCVYFDTDTWDVHENGLIYTDDLFLHELKSLFNALGIAGNDVDYSEQGMQDAAYVSLDVDKDFLESWAKFNNEI
jgi:hypothetical protein